MDETALKNLTHRLQMALDNAFQASVDLDRLRVEHGLGPALATSHRQALAEARVYLTHVPSAAESAAARAQSTAALILAAGRVRRGEVVDVREAQRLAEKDKFK